jgi:hypothetical protein
MRKSRLQKRCGGGVLRTGARLARGIQGTTIHKALVRNHGYSGSYSAVRRFLQALDTHTPAATVMLEFVPGEASTGGLRRQPDARM